MGEFDLARVDEQKAAEMQSPVEYDAAAEARVRRKLDRHMMPLFFILCECDPSGIPPSLDGSS